MEMMGIAVAGLPLLHDGFAFILVVKKTGLETLPFGSALVLILLLRGVSGVKRDLSEVRGDIRNQVLVKRLAGHHGELVWPHVKPGGRAQI